MHHQCRSWPPGPQPRRSYSPIDTCSTRVSSGRSIQSYVRRIGSCQQTSGLVSSGSRPSFSARMWSEQPAPAGNPGRFRKMHAPSQRRVCFSPSSSACVHPLSLPTSWNCHSSGVRRATCPATRFSSSSSEKCAPSVQQPSEARPTWMPWQPLPKMQVQREVSQVRSQRKICSSSAGSGNSTQARGKSSPFSSATALAFPGLRDFGGFAGFRGFKGLPFSARWVLAPWSSLPVSFSDRVLLAFFVFGTNPSLSAPYTTPRRSSQ